MHLKTLSTESKKLVAIAATLLIVQVAFAEGKDSSNARQATETPDDSNYSNEEDSESSQRKLREVSTEDRTRLRRDLDTYSRSLDPIHSQIEENRILMRKRLQERFFAADKDSDGTLSRIEAAEMMPQIARHFSQVDLNGDEAITMNELAAAQNKALERQRIEDAQLEELEKAVLKKNELASKQKNKQADSTRKRAL